MGKIVYITGGARSGKSTFGEDYVNKLNKDKIYIATAKIWDKEMENRVDLHKEQRGDSWETIEVYRDFDVNLKYIDKNSGILLDCVTNMITNIIFEDEIDWDNITMEEVAEVEEKVEVEIEKLVEFGKKHSGTLVLISNELGMGLVPPYPLGRHFRDIAGRMNQKLAKVSDEAYLIVSGLELRLK